MVGSFIVLALVFVLRLTLGTLTDRFSWMSKVLPYLNYGIYVALGLFVLFTVLTLIKVISGGRRSNRR